MLYLLIFLIVLVIWWNIEDKRKHAGYPPGPKRFPIVGNLPQLINKSPYPALALEELAKQFGDVMYLNIGNWNAVVFTSHETISEIYHHEKAYGRGYKVTPIITDRAMGKNLGVLFGEGEVWQTLRRFTLRTLRDFGFGKSMMMDVVIDEEYNKFSKYMDSLIGANGSGIVHFEGFFDLTVINTLWRLVTGKIYTLEDPQMHRLLNLSNDMINGTNFGFDLSLAYPFFWDWFPKWTGRTEQLRIRDALYDYAREEINGHRKSGEYKTDPQCFIDVFLAKIDESSNDPETKFNDENLLMTVLDLFQAGSETTSKTLSFGVLYMVLNPHVQSKVQEEIDIVSPNGTPINMAMKSKLPYVHATILEILRQSTVLPFPPTRQAIDDFYYRGNLIPKGTVLLTNVQSIHYNEKVWGDPYTFRPERFLNDMGTIDKKVADLVIAFGGGKRQCLGQTLAETNLFVYYANLMRQYSFNKVPGKPDPSTVPVLGMTYSPQPFDTLVVRRTTGLK